MTSCLPEWKSTADECPYGTGLPGDVTYPNDPSPSEIICVVYSFMPYLIAIIAVIALIARRGTRQMYFCIFGGLVVVLGELIWKSIARQTRPIGSCLVTCGMPSSHATISVGYFVWITLEVALRRDFVSKHNVDTQHLTPPGVEMTRDEVVDSCDTVAPEIRRRKWSEALHPFAVLRRLFVVLLWGGVTLPIAPCRAVLRDHSWMQVLAGSFVGLGEATVWYFLLNTLLVRFTAFIEGRRCFRRFGRPNYIPNHSSKMLSISVPDIDV
eukprot:TRINITY_DN6586_c0_g2_i1.p1 TRINITY_DN6586_c0_g2~~TRINITY_DN6586_c0_g2_i1.p1  ORF type:complete len:268 (+),score=5.04 TRINITY_DN6586_c0_g2_i1:108-911(+)